MRDRNDNHSKGLEELRRRGFEVVAPSTNVLSGLILDDNLPRPHTTTTVASGYQDDASVTIFEYTSQEIGVVRQHDRTHPSTEQTSIFQVNRVVVVVAHPLLEGPASFIRYRSWQMRLRAFLGLKPSFGGYVCSIRTENTDVRRRIQSAFKPTTTRVEVIGWVKLEHGRMVIYDPNIDELTDVTVSTVLDRAGFLSMALRRPTHPMR